MDHARLVPEGATIERVYLAIPTHYSAGEEFPNTEEGWDAAVTAVQAKKAALVESLTESMRGYATAEQVEQTANVQTRLDVRWKIAYPGGGSIDAVVASYADVDRLRVRA